MNSNRLATLLEMYDEENHDSFILFAIAKEYYYQNDINKSIETFERLRFLDEPYVGLYYQLAKLYEEVGEPQKALKVYEDGIQQAKKQADFHAISELMNAKTNLEMEI
jgi:tetratricopeptide (TPR) repeat protein